MFAEIDLLGAFVLAIAVWFVAALPIFVLADAALTRAGFYWCSGTSRLCAFRCSSASSAQAGWA
jgi:hypothetical protein